MALRCALQAGLGPRRCAGSPARRWRACSTGRRRPTSARRRASPREALDLLLERCHSHLASGFARFVGGGDWEEPVVLARLACAVGTDGPHADVFSAVLGELDRLEAEMAPAEPGQRFPFALRHLVHALVIARTPDVPLPGRGRRRAADAGGRRRPSIRSPRRRRASAAARPAAAAPARARRRGRCARSGRTGRRASRRSPATREVPTGSRIVTLAARGMPVRRAARWSRTRTSKWPNTAPNGGVKRIGSSRLVAAAGGAREVQHVGAADLRLRGTYGSCVPCASAVPPAARPARASRARTGRRIAGSDANRSARPVRAARRPEELPERER